MKPRDLGKDVFIILCIDIGAMLVLGAAVIKLPGVFKFNNKDLIVIVTFLKPA
jgi:hypothetical protein